MSSKPIKLSKSKIEDLRKELSYLKTRGRLDISERLKDIQLQNTEELESPYEEVTEDKFFLEKRISEIEIILSKCEEIDEGSVGGMKVEIGSKVTVGMESFQNVYIVVDPIEADPLNGKISSDSPVGKAILGASVGDTVEVVLGNNKSKLRILNID